MASHIPHPRPLLSSSQGAVGRDAVLRQSRQRGFTLVELLVVVIVLGLLAAIAVPTFLSQRKKGVDASIKSDLVNAAKAVETWAVDNPADLDGPAGVGTVLSNYTAPDNLSTTISLPGSGIVRTTAGNFVEIYANSSGQGFCVAGASVAGSRGQSRLGATWPSSGRAGASV